MVFQWGIIYVSMLDSLLIILLFVILDWSLSIKLIELDIHHRNIRFGTLPPYIIYILYNSLFLKQKGSGSLKTVIFKLL